MTQNDVFFRGALTWVSDANFEGARFSSVTGFGTSSVTGKRLPYAPEVLLSAALGYSFSDFAEVQVEYVFTDRMFTDDLNTFEVSANGQRGVIPESSIWNVALNVTPKDWKIGFFATVKNVTDEKTIVDRARGILPGSPRLFQGGITARF